MASLHHGPRADCAPFHPSRANRAPFPEPTTSAFGCALANLLQAYAPMTSKRWFAAGLAIVVLILGASIVNGYNTLVALDQSVRAQWGQVENVYQRRADLVPNLVETVKGRGRVRKGDLRRCRRRAIARWPSVRGWPRKNPPRSAGVPALPASPRRSVERPVAADGRHGALPGSESDWGLSRSSSAA